jgi:hypothetical protein
VPQVLPLSINGAVAMAQLVNDPDVAAAGGGGGLSGSGVVSSRQFFLYKFERSQAGLAGLSFDEGEFAVFGYVTEVGEGWFTARKVTARKATAREVMKSGSKWRKLGGQKASSCVHEAFEVGGP